MINISADSFLSNIVGLFTIDSIKRITPQCFHYEASALDINGIKRLAWVKIYPIYQYSNNVQTTSEMDDHFYTQKNIANLTSRHLTKIYSTFDKKDSPPACIHHIISMKRYKDGDLKSYYSTRRQLIGPPQKMQLMHTIFEAVKYLHSQLYSHNSITPDHIMVEDGVAYLGGLSSAKKHTQQIPLAVLTRDLQDLAGCLCFIEFGAELHHLSTDELIQRLAHATHIPSEYSVGMKAYLSAKKQLSTANESRSTSNQLINNDAEISVQPPTGFSVSPVSTI
jgi:serine/threonine protein kinase